jgi:hypothetical protein
LDLNPIFDQLLMVGEEAEGESLGHDDEIRVGSGEAVGLEDVGGTVVRLGNDF